MDYPQSLTDKNRGPGDVALAVVLTVISTIVIMLRVYSKLFVIRTMGWDDGMMVVAVVRTTSTILFLNILTLGTRYFPLRPRPPISALSSMAGVDIIIF